MLQPACPLPPRSPHPSQVSAAPPPTTTTPTHPHTAPPFSGSVEYMEVIDQHDEALWVVERIEELHRQGEPYREMAVVYRNNNHVGGGLHCGLVGCM